RVLAARGHKLALVDAERGRERLAELGASLGGACVVAGDIAREATGAEAMPRIERELGSARVRAALIAGAWRGGKPLHEEAGDDVWRAMMEANLETVHRSLRALLPAMVAGKLGSGGGAGDERGRGGVRGVEGGGGGAGAGGGGGGPRQRRPCERGAPQHDG